MTSSGRTKFNVLFSVIVLGLLGSFIIFFRFNSIPKTLTFDEIEFAKLALSLDKGGYVPYSPLATGHATLYFYVLLFSMKMFGISSFALRLPSAVFGVLSVLIFYFVLQKSVKKMVWWLPFVGTFLLITTRWYFNFARFGFEGTFVLLLELVSLFFFLHYLDHREKKWLISSGLFAGLAYNSYQPGRLFFALILTALFLFILERSKKRLDFSFFSKQSAQTFLAFLIPFIVIITPLSVYLSQHRDVRIYQQLYPVNNEMSVGEKFQFFSRNVVSTTLMFSVRGDVNGRHNYPNKAALNPIMSALFMLGMLLCLFHLKNRMNQLYILYFSIAVFPTLFTYPWENPNMLRTFTCLPAIMYFSVSAIGWTYHLLETKYHLRYRTLIVGIFLTVCISAMYDVRTYFVFQADVFREAFEAKMPLIYYIEH